MNSQVDRRDSARIVRSALDEVKSIQTLLADVYKDAGDGRTLLRELVQNADDAAATRLVFVVLDKGWLDARNSLLRGPALLALNDGPFPAKDRDALHQAIGGAKADKAGKVGRFGIGLKSVFHICEAIVYVGAEAGVLRPGALNPWAGTGEAGDSDPLHPDWDTVDDDDLERLVGVANNLLGEFDKGLIQWIPLRKVSHLDRAQDRQYGVGQVCPVSEDVGKWFGRSESLTLLLAQCGNLSSIEADRVNTPKQLDARRKLAQVVRPAFKPKSWVGRYDDDLPVPDRSFEGIIESREQKCLVHGTESLGSDGLHQLRVNDWPSDPIWRDGRCEWVPRKALAHAAITVVRPECSLSAQCGVRLRWAVFLPLDDDPVPRTSTLVETAGGVSDKEMLEIILHGYFWPSHDRRSIPGVTDEDAGVGDSEVRVRWNRAVRDELLLPLLPSVMADALSSIPEPVGRVCLKAIEDSSIVRKNLPAVTRRHILLPLLTDNGVRWQTKDLNACEVVSIPQWAQAPVTVRMQLSERLRNLSEAIAIIDADAPRLGGRPGEWQPTWIERLLECISTEDLRSQRTLIWVAGLVRHLLGSPDSKDDQRTVTVANWLAGKVGEGALSITAEGTSTDEQKEGRTSWLRLLETLPEAWLIHTPVESQRAVVELASEGFVGEGFFPIPFGRQSAKAPLSRPDPNRLDQALSQLGRRLGDNENATQREHRSRLVLAETLLAVRGNRPLNDELRTLPLLRARRLPADKDDAWSVDELRQQTIYKRVFARSNVGDGEDGSILDSPSDPKRSVEELAQALGENVWLVADSVASTGGVPVPNPMALAQAVIHPERIQSVPDKRSSLLKRLSKHTEDATVYRAVRMLLTGRASVAGDESALYYVRSQDVDRGANQRTLNILLQLLDRRWCAVAAESVEQLPHELVLRLGVKAVDAGPFRRLLYECLNRQVDWAKLDRLETLHLLQRLHGMASEDRDGWRDMPLHRTVNGERCMIDDRTRRAEGHVLLPEELRTEICLLEPDPEVADLYQDVRILDDDGVLRAMLMSPQPQQFAVRILQALRSGNDRRVSLPRDEEMYDLIKRKAWLPSRKDCLGLAPNQLLTPPSELEAVVTQWAEAGALRDCRLPSSIAPSVWDNAKEVVHEINGRPNHVNQIQSIASVLDSNLVSQFDSGAYAILPEPRLVDSSLVGDALQTPLAGSHEGWAFVQAAANVVGLNGETLADAGKMTHDAVLGIARSLCGPVPVQFQIKMLATLAATRPSKESHSGRLHRKLIDVFRRNDEFLSGVLPHITLPTQDGQWKRPHQIARSESGLARSHRVVAEYRTYLRLDTEESVQQKSGTRAAGAELVDTATELRRYFEPWADRVPGGAIGAFLSLLGKGKYDGILRLAQEWLGDDVSVEVIQRKLFGEDRTFSDTRVFFSGQVAGGQYVDAFNLLGERVEMEAATDQQTIFAADPDRLDHWRGDLWNPGLGDIELGSSSSAGARAFLPFLSLNLRDVEPQRRTSDELRTLLSGTVEWWTSKILKLELQQVRAWWSHWGSGSQAQIQTVQASILAHLPLTLKELGVQDCEPLRNALKGARRAQIRRERASSSQLREATDAERTALDKLASLIRDDSTHREFLLGRIREQIQCYGYRADSVLLELAQNADDALAQAAEIAGGSLPSAARRLVIQVHEVDGQPTVDVTHHGRAINDTGGASFPAGLDREWDQDLYFMMLLNLSGKPGELPGQATRSSTTGRFGLGFKSVHLVSSRPSVVSGFLAFLIAGGLLPQEEPLPDDLDTLRIEGHRATRVRLPFRDDLSTSELVATLFRRFDYARTLMPAFARELRELVIEGGPSSGVSVFDGEPIEGASGWSVARDTTELPGHGRWRIMRFRPNSEGGETTTAALVIGLRDNIPTRFPSDLPFLWNVAPTSEGWGCGYAINGPFKLDPGRTHVSLDDDATLQVVNMLGEALGRSLVDLHDALTCQADGDSRGLPTGKDARVFLASLWTLLASGVNSPDKLRRELLLRLHGSGWGLSNWMSARAVVPSGLPKPFPERLPPLRRETRIEVAAEGLDNLDLCRAFAEIEDVATVARSRCVISRKVAARLRPLVSIPMPELKPADVMAKLAERWGQHLTPARLKSLRPLASDTTWSIIGDAGHTTPWHSQLVARSAGGTPELLRDLLLPRHSELQEATADVDDELLRAAFAPDENTLDPSYITCAKDLTVFLHLRVRHQIDAATMAKWFKKLPMMRRPAALLYLLHGRLQQEVLQRLVPYEGRPDWLEDYDEVRQMLDDLDAEYWRCQQLLAALFPSRFQESPEQSIEPILPESTKRTFFKRLQDWWNEDDVRRAVIGSYEEKAWPAWLRQEGVGEGLKDGSQDHWLGLLVLGTFQSLGWADDAHHRNFLERAHAEGWWDVFKSPEKTLPWMEVLRTWQDRSVADLEYSRWMSCFPAIYQLSRYLQTYRRLLSTAGRRPDELYRVTCLLSPRVDEALTGAGQHFDAPSAPLNMGLHWVLRELVRMNVLDGDHLLADCWVPSDQVLRFLYPLGMKTLGGNSSNVEKAHAVFDFLKSELHIANPHLHRAFDIPLRHVDANKELRRQLGLEE